MNNPAIYDALNRLTETELAQGYSQFRDDLLAVAAHVVETDRELTRLKERHAEVIAINKAQTARLVAAETSVAALRAANEKIRAKP